MELQDFSLFFVKETCTGPLHRHPQTAPPPHTHTLVPNVVTYEHLSFCQQIGANTLFNLLKLWPHKTKPINISCVCAHMCVSLGAFLFASVPECVHTNETFPIHLGYQQLHKTSI